MTHETLALWIRSTAYAVVATAAVLAVVIIVAEELPHLKNWLKATFSHHWLGKGALAIALFVVVGVASRFKRDATQLSTVIIAETIAVVAAAAAIAGFFLLHTLKVV